MLPNSDSEGKDSVDLIRDSLFSIQVEQPWLLLQFGNSNAEEIGTDRVEALVSVSPEDEDGKTREEVVKTEIEDNDNNNLTIPQVVNRLGMVFFLLFFNLGITIFVFLLTGMMLFSQILFIIFAMFLPISFLLSMIPSYESMAKQAIVRVFNTIMTRAGITLIVTVAFSISSMFYNISTDYPFFMVAFLQIVCFAGIYMKLGDLMSMFSLNAGDSQNMGRRIFRRPYLFMRHRANLAESFAREKSGGKKVTYTNPIAVAKNGGWRYQYGNQFYVELVNQYLTVPQVSGELAQKVMNEALKYQGWKYVYGGSNPNTSFDCSGLTQWCYGKAGISLPRTAQAQYDATQHLPLSQAKAGDLVFFHSTYNAGSYVTHVGILVSPTQMYHAGDPIGYADLSSSYWQQHLIGAGRVKQ